MESTRKFDILETQFNSRVALYVVLKSFALVIAFCVAVQVARIFYTKEEILQVHELAMEAHHQRMTGISRVNDDFDQLYL